AISGAGQAASSAAGGFGSDASGGATGNENTSGDNSGGGVEASIDNDENTTQNSQSAVTSNNYNHSSQLDQADSDIQFGSNAWTDVEDANGKVIQSVRPETMAEGERISKGCNCKVEYTSILRDGASDTGFGHPEGYKADIKNTPELTNYIQNNPSSGFVKVTDRDGTFGGATYFNRNTGTEIVFETPLKSGTQILDVKVVPGSSPTNY
ncbi:MAG: hypothetical protein NT091_02840, partial [Candidatus Falkowbacteria bacterium]|nr:hypothetical protein [Candidatus Falkowbacteria bacterium]